MRCIRSVRLSILVSLVGVVAACDPGPSSESSSDAGYPCPAGTYSSTGADGVGCTPCPLETFSSEQGATFCSGWSTCGGLDYESVAPSATNDRQCTSSFCTGWLTVDRLSVYDSITGLQWQRAEGPNLVVMVDAGSYCSNLDLGGHTDWRLPGKTELEGLVDVSMSPTINACAFPSTSAYGFWSSTAYSSTETWAVDFATGGSVGALRSSLLRVRCVR